MNAERCMQPHIYSIAETAYKGIIHNKKNQCCLISGESGAGKSESAKFFTNQLLSMDPSVCMRSVQHTLISSTNEITLNIAQTHVAAQNTRKLEENISRMNPLLEAFGNARTVCTTQ